jgi:hypothetical protein
LVLLRGLPSRGFEAAAPEVLATMIDGAVVHDPHGLLAG